MQQIKIFIATLGFGRRLPMAATTSGIVYGPIGYLIVANLHQLDLGIAVYTCLLLAVIGVGLWCIPTAERLLGPTIDPKGNTRVHDQNQIVIDELLGFLVACLPFFVLPFSGWNFIIAFCVFRFFDIVKVMAPGAKAFDKMHNSFGVMCDDLVAGIYSAAVVYTLVKYAF